MSIKIVFVKGLCRRIIWGLSLAIVLMLVPATRGTAKPPVSEVPPWLPSAVIYCVYPSIFSPSGDLAGVTAQIPRLKTLGVTVLWLMPVTPIGRPIDGHPSINSPYCVHDYYAINPQYGTGADLTQLVTRAHHLGIKVILDEVLNHTAWDNALITQHPKFYIHTDGNPQNSKSIREAFNYADVAQLDYANHELWAYMTRMLKYWVMTYHVDGFRFDTASNPGGPKRMISAGFWQSMASELKQVNPDLLLLGECEDPELAQAPFGLDYGWDLHYNLQKASTGSPVSDVVSAWQRQNTHFPAGMLHLSLQDDWDEPRDINVYGGVSGALATAVLNFTINGVPLLYNGMEIGNAAGGVNPRAPIDWGSGQPEFPIFYRQLIALRHKNPALQQGSLVWLTNSVPSQVLTYTRSDGKSEFLVEINLSDTEADGTVSLPVGKAWTEVTPSISLNLAQHQLPPNITLPPKGFAIFQRPVSAKSK